MSLFLVLRFGSGSLVSENGNVAPRRRSSGDRRLIAALLSLHFDVDLALAVSFLRLRLLLGKGDRLRVGIG